MAFLFFFFSFFFYCSQLQTHFWPAVFLSKDLTKWLHWNLSALCFESQSAAVVTPESNERLFIIIKWIDQRSLHVQKYNDLANEIVPLSPSQWSNYIVKGHGGLTEMGRFSMTQSWTCLSCCMRIFFHRSFLTLLKRTLASSFPGFTFLCASWLEYKGRNRTVEAGIIWEPQRLQSCDDVVLLWAHLS